MRAFIGSSLLGLGLAFGCAPSSDDDADFAAAVASVPVDGKADGATLGTTVQLTLTHAAFPGQKNSAGAVPNAVFYLPTHLDITQSPSLVVFLHGHNNCVTNVLGAVNKSCDARRGTPARNAYNLAGQLEATQKNAILVALQLSYDVASSEAGHLADANALADILAEALPQLPVSVSAADLGAVYLVSHSGGYKAAAALARTGGLPVTGVVLLDSLYGSTGDYDAWVEEDLQSFVDHARSLSIVYTGGGGTLANSQAMAARARAWFSAGHLDGGALLDDRSTRTLGPAQLATPLLWKRSGLTHDNVPRYYFGKLVGALLP